VQKRSEAKTPSNIEISRSFAVATKETSVSQYLEFRKEQKYLKEVSPEESCPIYVSFFEAMAYCRWLSEKEGVAEDQMCYPPVAEILQGKLPREGYLERTGYRLTTSAEWEAVCRSGGLDEASCDLPRDLLGEYAWYQDNAGNHTWPVGTARPNELGCFDLLGNLQEWCHTRDDSASKSDGYFATRGTWVSSPIYYMKCLDAAGFAVANTPLIGFRVVRTMK
jgi:formylglycine-generating enzyme required for sulfatase activity